MFVVKGTNFIIIYVLHITSNIVLCPELMEPANASVIFEGAEGVGQAAFYVCNKGYRLEGETEVLICGHDGMWDNEPPTCLESKNIKQECVLNNV